MSLLKEQSQAWAELVEKTLDHLLPGEKEIPQIIHGAMRYSVFAGGKRLRPILCLAAVQLLEGSQEEALPLACALEMIHTYSLVHDDHPDLDNDSLRRGKPTNHMVYGNAMAILAGDALLTQAFEILNKEALREKDALKIARRLQANYEITRAIGTRGMIGGQVVDILSEKSPVKDTQILQYIHTHKTGDLITASVRSGALLAGAEEKTLLNLTIYAEKIGMAFQITDDILDIEGDQAALGKDIGSDEKNEKLTFPSLYGMEASRSMAAKAVEEAVAALQAIPGNHQFLEELARYILQRRS